MSPIRLKHQLLITSGSDFMSVFTEPRTKAYPQNYDKNKPGDANAQINVNGQRPLISTHGCFFISTNMLKFAE